jgi:CheY-like chemotaxis protein
MSQVVFISELIATPHIAQIIHQKGLLIFANLAAARLFGFDTAAAFVDFSHRTNLFGEPATTPSKTRNRTLTFCQLYGTKVKAKIKEQSIIWNGNPCAYVTMIPLANGADNTAQSLDDTVTLHPTQVGEEEAYFVDSIHAALDNSRQDSGKLVHIRKPFDLAVACMRICDDLTPYAEALGVTLSLEISPKALNIFTGDAAKLSRAATCMVRHAIGRVPGGNVRIKLLVDEAGESIRFDVCDNGRPYTSWESISLMDPPPLQKEVAAPNEEAPPLDLPMAQCIANFLGGTISLKVNHIAGGLIRLKLPFPIAQGEVRHRRHASDTHLPLRILVAEDNFTSQQVIKIILQALGYAPTIVANGAQCIEALSYGSYDVIFMDLHMPIMDGYAATRKIRADEAAGGRHNSPMPILALTADTRAKTRLKSKATGVTGFLTKPVHIPQILSALSPIIDAIRTRDIPAPSDLKAMATA